MLQLKVYITKDFMNILLNLKMKYVCVLFMAFVYKKDERSVRFPDGMLMDILVCVTHVYTRIYHLLINKSFLYNLLIMYQGKQVNILFGYAEHE